MARVRFMPPLSKLTTDDTFYVESETLGELCIELITRYNLERALFFTNTGELTMDIVILVNRRNAVTLHGVNTKLTQQSEVLIMQYLVGG